MDEYDVVVAGPVGPAAALASPRRVLGRDVPGAVTAKTPPLTRRRPAV